MARTFTLPDGSVVDLGPECFRAPEILFNPAIVGEEYVASVNLYRCGDGHRLYIHQHLFVCVRYPGIQQCLAHCIASVDLDLRRVLYVVV